MTDLLVTGGTGMVGQAIARQAPKGLDLVLVGSRQYDLRKASDARKMLRIYKAKSCDTSCSVKLGEVKANTEQVAVFL